MKTHRIPSELFSLKAVRKHARALVLSALSLRIKTPRSNTNATDARSPPAHDVRAGVRREHPRRARAVRVLVRLHRHREQVPDIEPRVSIRHVPDLDPPLGDRGVSSTRRAGGWLEPKAIERRALLQFSVVNGVSIGFLNLSLGYNSVGFYQMTKLAIIPCTVAIQQTFYQKQVRSIHWFPYDRAGEVDADP